MWLSHKVWQTWRKAHCWMCHSKMGPLWLCLTLSLTETQNELSHNRDMNEHRVRRGGGNGKVKMNRLVFVRTLHSYSQQHGIFCEIHLVPCAETSSHTHTRRQSYVIMPKIQRQINRHVCVIHCWLGGDELHTVSLTDLCDSAGNMSCSNLFQFESFVLYIHAVLNCFYLDLDLFK